MERGRKLRGSRFRVQGSGFEVQGSRFEPFQNFVQKSKPKLIAKYKNVSIFVVSKLILNYLNHE
jgi:hypothetical protein